MRGTDQEVGTGLAGSIWAIGRQRSGLGKRWIVRLERAVDLIRRDLNVTRNLRRPCRIEQALCSQDVGTQKWRRVADRAVDMAFGGEVHQSVEFSLGHQWHHQRPIGDIPVYKLVARACVNAREVVGIAGIRQRIEIRDLDRRIGLQEIPHEVGADEATAPGHQDPLDRIRTFHAHDLSFSWCHECRCL